MKVEDFIKTISEDGKFRVYGYYKNYNLIFRRDDGVVFIYRG